MHGLHPFRLPLAQEFPPLAIQHCYAPVAARAFAIGHIYVAIFRIDKYAGWHKEHGGIRIQRLAL